MPREGNVRPTDAELRALRSETADEIVKRSGLTARTVYRLLAGQPVMRSSLKLAMQAVETVKAGA